MATSRESKFVGGYSRWIDMDRETSLATLNIEGSASVWMPMVLADPWHNRHLVMGIASARGQGWGGAACEGTGLRCGAG